MNSIIQAQGIHHITLNGADKKTSIDFWQNILGMKFIFEQPNLDDLDTNHLYFDCGDGTTVTVFTNEKFKPNKQKLKNECGDVHHVAFWVSQSTIRIAEKNLNENGFANTGIKDRGFMDSIYFREPLGLLIELASYKFDPPIGFSHANVLEKAHEIRVKRKALNIQDEDIASAIKALRN
ncbi:MAG: glyoxalase [Alphaproteobacteria bacterium TMED199]|jgi:glyoxalase family protein|nr:MAG: glyoxalase [Alphaproteobacteria bacterium TMED199]|tara:strand:+ start:203 stop:739 length:537 start_codon:yes stop_codon:yes gene_type:complete